MTSIYNMDGSPVLLDLEEKISPSEYEKLDDLAMEVAKYTSYTQYEAFRTIVRLLNLMHKRGWHGNKGAN